MRFLHRKLSCHKKGVRLNLGILLFPLPTRYHKNSDKFTLNRKNLGI